MEKSNEQDGYLLRGQKFAHDPIIQSEDGRWTFLDETWNDSEMRYYSREAAEKGLFDYCNWLEGPSYGDGTIGGIQTEE